MLPGPSSSARHEPCSLFFSLYRSTKWVMKTPNITTAALR